VTGANREQPVRVNVGICRCSGSPHTDGDWVELRPKPSLRLGLAAQGAAAAANDVGEMAADVGLAFMRHGVEAWSFVDNQGKPIPLTFAEIERQLDWDTGGKEVADAAADLYTEAVFGPLDREPSSTPPLTPQTDSTSPNPLSGPTSLNSPSQSSLFDPVDSTPLPETGG
jgi:hypothetical protein